MATVSRTNNISVMYIRNFLAMYDNLDAECLDVGTLCTKANNKWSKYKPVRFPQDDTTSYPDWWKDSSGYCGLDVKRYTTISSMFVALRAGVTQWDYLKPSGGNAAPYRLLDFIGYSTDALPPFDITALKDTYYIGIDNLDAVISVKTTNVGGILLSDLGYAFNLADMYFGLGFSRQGTTTYQYLTSLVKAGSSTSVSVSTPTTGITAGYYHVSLFFSEQYKALADADPVNNFAPAPDRFKLVTIKAFTLNITLTGSVETSSVNYSVNINNSETVGYTLNNCYVVFRYGTRTPNDPEQAGEGKVSLGNISCSPGTTQNFSGQILNVAQDFPDRGGKHYFTNTSSSTHNREITL